MCNHSLQLLHIGAIVKQSLLREDLHVLIGALPLCSKESLVSIPNRIPSGPESLASNIQHTVPKYLEDCRSGRLDHDLAPCKEVF